MVAAGAASTLLQWPVWHLSPLLATINTLLAVGHAAVAPLLRESGSGTPRRIVPLTFGLAGVCRSGTWVGLWDDSVPNLLGQMFNSGFWLLMSVALLFWSHQVNRWERGYLVFAAVAMIGGDIVSALTDGSRTIRSITNVLDLLLIAAFLTLVVRRLGRARGLERRTLRTAQFPAVVSAIAVLVAWPFADSSSGHGLLWVPTVIGIALLALPITVAAATARLAAERADVADAVTGLSWPVNPHRLQSALRRALRDPSIEVGYWVEALQRYVDADGQEVKIPADDRFAVICQDGRALDHADGTLPDVGPDDGEGQPVALLVGGQHHRHRTDLIGAAVRAAGSAFALAGLQTGIRAERDDLTAAHRQVEESRWAERRRLEQNLHDGAQHRLAALTMRLGAAGATVPLDSRARDLVGEIQDEIREVLRELRELADGIHPSTLTEAGLGPALEAVADRFPVPVTIIAPARRFPPVVEAVAYYSTTEVLTIVTRQLHAAEITVEVTARSGDLWVRTTGVGVGNDSVGRLFDPLRSGLRAIGGELLTPSEQLVPGEHGNGYPVTARIPCA
jgi:signal transduction histidine kinase